MKRERVFTFRTQNLESAWDVLLDRDNIPGSSVLYTKLEEETYIFPIGRIENVGESILTSYKERNLSVSD